MNDYLQNEDSESSPLVIPSLQPKDFPPLVTEYEIGDCVKIQNGEFSTSFGIISRIGTEADPNFYSKFWFKSFITVEEAYGKPPLKHHSDNEIVKYFDIEKEDLKAITCRVEIMFYYDYIEKYHKDAVKNGLKRIEVPSNVYFYRQHKVIPSGELYPALEPNCVWRKILNINDTLFEWPSQCGKLYHVAWFLSSSVRSCSKCGCNIEHSTIGLNTPNIGRKRDDKADAKLADPMCEQSFMQALSQQSDSDHLDSTKSSQNSQEQSKRRPKSLVDFIENKRREIRLEDKQSKLHPDALKRKKVREKLLFLFLDAIEECKANGDPFTSLEDIQISEHSSYQKSYELAWQFANLIETEVWVSTAKQITENYSKKVISILLVAQEPRQQAARWTDSQTQGRRLKSRQAAGRRLGLRRNQTQTTTDRTKHHQRVALDQRAAHRRVEVAQRRRSHRA